MAYPVGGIASKLGNRYEARWVVEKYIDLLRGKIISILFDSFNPDEHLIDVMEEATNGVKIFSQCKGRQGDACVWDIKTLFSSGIPAKACSLLRGSPETSFRLVSPIAFIEYMDLRERVKTGVLSVDEYLNGLDIGTAKDKDFLDTLSQKLSRTADPIPLKDFISRFEVYQYSDNPDAVERLNYSLSGVLYSGNRNIDDNLFSIIRDIAEERMGRPVLTQEFLEALRKQGICSRRQQDVTNTIECSKNLQQDFMDSFFLIQGNCIPRAQTQEVVSALENGKNVVLLGDRGAGKSGVLYEAINTLAKNPNNCIIPIRLDRRVPEKTTRHFGEDLGLFDSPVRCLALIPGKDRLAILILDQVDALRWTSGAGEAALGICRSLLREMQFENSSAPRIQVILSVRKVDYENDPGLKGLLNDKKVIEFTEITIAPFTEESLRVVVENIKPGTFAELTPRQKKLLVYPHMLYMWERLIKDRQEVMFESERDLCKGFVDDCTNAVAKLGFPASDSRTFLSSITDDMEKNNRLWAPTRLGDSQHFEAFQSTGLLKIARDKVLFGHQSFMDYLIVLRFLNSGRTLEAWVLSGRQDFLFREQLKLALLYLHGEGMDRFVRECNVLVQNENIRFHLKHLLFVVISGMDPEDKLFGLVSGWLDTQSVSKEVYNIIFRGHSSWVGKLDTSGRLEKLIEATTENEQQLGLSLLQSVSDKTPDLVKKYWTRITTPRDRCGILPWSAAIRLDCFVGFRIDLLGEERCSQFFDWSEMINVYPNETVKILKFLTERISMSTSSNGDVDLSWILPKSYQNSMSMGFSWLPEQITLKGPRSSVFLNELLPEVERWTSVSRLNCDKNKFLYTSQFSGIENRDHLMTFIFDAVLFFGKRLALGSPQMLCECLSSYRTTDSPVVDLIIAECYLALPDEYANEVLSWLLIRPDGFLLRDWRGDGFSRWRMTAKLIERFSARCSGDIFLKLEDAILKARDNQQIDFYKRSPKSDSCPWGSPQEFLLPHLDKQRTCDSVKGLIGVLSRRLRRYRNSDCGLEMISGCVQSPVHRKMLSPNRWHKTIFQTEKIKKGRDWSWKKGGDDIIFHSDVDAFSSDLMSQVLLAPEKFVSFAVSEDISGSTDVRYLEAISEGTTYSNYGNAPTRVKIDIQTCVNFWNKYFTRWATGRIANNFCSMMQNRADECWSMHFYDWLFELAARPEKESFYLNEMSFSSAVFSTTQASAIAAISEAIWAHSELAASFLPRIRSEFFTIENSITLCSVVDYLCLAVWKHDQQLAVDLFFYCVGKDARCVTGNNVVRFMNYTMQDKYTEYKPLFKKLLCSSNPHARRFAVREIIARHIIFDFFKDEFDVLILSSDSQDKENISDVLKKLAGDERYFEKCVQFLFVFQNDKEQDVRTNASGWISRKTLTFPCAPTLFNQWMETSQFVNKGLQYVLENFESPLSPFAKGILVMAKTSQYADPVERYHFHLLPGILVRLYEEVLASANGEGQKLCLDALDNMFKTNMFEVREVVDKLVESDTRNRGG